MDTIDPAETLPSDEDLVRRSLEDPALFGVIFDRHFATIYGYLARRVGVVVADDLASQTFVVAFERRASLQPHQGGARPWLYRIATNLLGNQRRMEQRLLDTAARVGRQSLTDLSLEAASAEQCALGNIKLQEAATALSGLDPAHREVLFLHLWAELSYEEMAVALDIPIGTVRSRLSRARRAARAAPSRTPTDRRGLLIPRQEKP
jgi:RNA polymerase sigma factor (sigma-70 family)